jgi:hypothetical protein
MDTSSRFPKIHVAVPSRRTSIDFLCGPRKKSSWFGSSPGEPPPGRTGRRALSSRSETESSTARGRFEPFGQAEQSFGGHLNAAVAQDPVDNRRRRLQECGRLTAARPRGLLTGACDGLSGQAGPFSAPADADARPAKPGRPRSGVNNPRERGPSLRPRSQSLPRGSGSGFYFPMFRGPARDAGMPVTLDSFQAGEIGRWNPRAHVALALAEFLLKKHPVRRPRKQPGKRGK